MTSRSLYITPIAMRKLEEWEEKKRHCEEGMLRWKRELHIGFP
jgi:hypothetical protein